MEQIDEIIYNMEKEISETPDGKEKIIKNLSILINILFVIFIIMVVYVIFNFVKNKIVNKKEKK